MKAYLGKENIIRKTHLVLSVFIVVPASFIYGFDLASQFDIHLQTTSEHNVFKAIMGLYLGFSVLWVLGLFKQKYFITALITNAVFMLGLGFGRMTSLLLDGLPTYTFIAGTLGELILGFYGLWVLKRTNN